MSRSAWILYLVLAAGTACAQPATRPDVFVAGVWADANRTVDCVNGSAGTTVTQHVWARAPHNAGLVYVTLRLDRSANLDFSARPVLHPLVSDLIITAYADGTVEWNLLLQDCPSGWIEIFTQDCVITGEETAAIRIVAANSMMRDCDFVLNEVEVLSDLKVNDPDCATATGVATWGSIKRQFE